MHALLLTLALAVTPAPADVYSLKGEAFTAAATQDLADLHRFVDGMQAVLNRALENKKLFSVKRTDVYSPEEKRTLLSTWGSLFAYFSATEGLRQKYWNFVKLAPTDPRHAWGFVLTHTALTALLANGMGFADVCIGNRQLETLFDEGNDEFGIPQSSFARFKAKAIHVATATQLMTGDTWAATAMPAFKRLTGNSGPQADWAWADMKTFSTEARAVLLRHGPKLFALSATDLAKSNTTEAIFPVQKSFAEWAGDTRVARSGKAFITRAQVEALVLPRLQPGDIVVSRMNWFLSNIGLPGFWPHAQLYVGTAGDLANAFDADPGVLAWVKSQPEKVETFSALLAKRYPEKWKTYAEAKDFQGHAPIRVIEAISEGVSFTAVEHAYGVDYLAAMRPRVPATEKARAVERAFKYQGRPYDFDFDFFSDATLVCTELVYKSYQPAADMKGVAFDLVDVAGRRTLPANEIVKRFDADYDTPNRQMDFVFFLDGKEKEQTAGEADLATFRGSWKRVKWDIAQK